jgi:hypothetical protein
LVLLLILILILVLMLGLKVEGNVLEKREARKVLFFLPVVHTPASSMPALPNDQPFGL